MSEWKKKRKEVIEQRGREREREIERGWEKEIMKYTQTNKERQTARERDKLKERET